MPLKDAARLVDRSLTTLRTWIRSGKLSVYRGEGTHPDNAPALVSRTEILALVVVEGKAANPGRPPAGPVPVELAPVEALAALRVELATVRAELAGARDLLAGARALAEAHLATGDALRATVAAVEARSRDLATAVEAERARAMGAEAERDALRAERGLPWWRRLLGGPAPALPGSRGRGEA